MPFTFHDWLYSNYAVNEPLNGRYSIIHFAVIAACLALIVLLGVWGRRCPRARRPLIVIVISFILLLELARRGINLSNVDLNSISLRSLLYLLLPRPWCAISCWMLISTLFIRTKAWYNLCSMNGILCAIVFFFYPEVGFIHKYYFFENVYSIATHALLLIASVLAIVYGYTDFRYFRKRWSFALWELIGMGAIVAYAIAESPLVLNVEPDPMYFLPGTTNAVMRVLGLDYPVYLAVYIGFLLFYYNMFYFVQYLVTPGKTGVKYHVPLGKHVLRLLFTFGIWELVWLFKTTRYTNRAEDLPRRHPFGKLMLCLFIPFYYFYWVYQTARRVDLLAEEQAIRSSLSSPCLITSLFLPILTPVILQEMINETVLSSAAFERARAEIFPENNELTFPEQPADPTVEVYATDSAPAYMPPEEDLPVYTPPTEQTAVPDFKAVITNAPSVDVSSDEMEAVPELNETPAPAPEVDPLPGTIGAEESAAE